MDMYSPVQCARETAYKFVENARFISLNEDAIKEVAKYVKENLAESKKFFQKPPNIPVGYEPCGLYNLNITETQKLGLITFELIANAINYQYWTGTHNMRINNASANLMYEFLEEAFCVYIPSRYNLHDIVESFITEMILARFPNIEKRVQHLRELVEENKRWLFGGVPYAASLVKELEHPMSADQYVLDLIKRFPGYADDIFIKRASLFFMQLYRKYGWFSKQIKDFIIPSDYQIPKILRFFKCIEYGTTLTSLINEEKLIPSGGLEEMEIRSASIVAADKIAKEADCSPCDVDTFLWVNRKICNDPFHLTITTHY